jgi:hypothetical protein
MHHGKLDRLMPRSFGHSGGIAQMLRAAAARTDIGCCAVISSAAKRQVSQRSVPIIPVVNG